jgi:hypothetical protein
MHKSVGCHCPQKSFSLGDDDERHNAGTIAVFVEIVSQRRVWSVSWVSPPRPCFINESGFV